MKRQKLMAQDMQKSFFQITFPLGKPILVTMGLFSALAYWNDWTNGLYYLSGNQGQKLYSIQNLLNQMITDIQYLASGKVAGNIGQKLQNFRQRP
mgnify:CR=1 FL=1